MKQEELNEIVIKHGMWLRNEYGGEQAYLARAYLARADLAGANLARADLGDNVLMSWSCEEYATYYANGLLVIGCQKHTPSEWGSFSKGRIMHMDGFKAVKFWESWKFRHILQGADILHQEWLAKQKKEAP